MLDMNSFDSLAVIVAANAMVVVFFAARSLRHIGREKNTVRRSRGIGTVAAAALKSRSHI
jgi:hypothetical protein